MAEIINSTEDEVHTVGAGKVSGVTCKAMQLVLLIRKANPVASHQWRQCLSLATVRAWQWQLYSYLSLTSNDVFCFVLCFSSMLLLLLLQVVALAYILLSISCSPRLSLLPLSLSKSMIRKWWLYHIFFKSPVFSVWIILECLLYGSPMGASLLQWVLNRFYLFREGVHVPT